MSLPTYTMEDVRQRGMLNRIHRCEKAGRGRWLVHGRRPFYLEAEEWELHDAGIAVDKGSAAAGAFFVGA